MTIKEPQKVCSEKKSEQEFLKVLFSSALTQEIQKNKNFELKIVRASKGKEIIYQNMK